MKNINKETINHNNIKKQFGDDIYIGALEYFGDKTGLSLIDKLKKDYDFFPKPYLITSIWDKDFLNIETSFLVLNVILNIWLLIKKYY